MAKETVAVLGTGTMGAPMARNLLAAGFEVRAWNRTRGRAEPLADDGATVADTAAEAVAGAARRADDAVRRAGGRGDDGRRRDALDDGALWIQSTTVGVVAEERLAGLARDRGIGYVDAPVLGTKRPAEFGELVVLASGAGRAAGARASRCSRRSASDTIRVGEAGAGSRLKLVANLWAVPLTEAVAEAIALAEGSGSIPQLFLDAMEGSAARLGVPAR